MQKRSKSVEDSDEDPEVNLNDFRNTAEELLKQSNVQRRASVQIKGPNQIDSQYTVYNRLVSGDCGRYRPAPKK